MEQLSYSFIITMLHSTWQMALLLGMSWLICATGNRSPLSKRNILLGALLVQVIASVFTFYYGYQYYQQDGTFSLLNIGLTESLNDFHLQSYTPAIFVCYLLVAAFKIFNNARSWYGFTYQYKKHLLKAPSDLKLFTKAKALHFGIKRKVTIWCSTHISSPVTFGFFKPVILLPVALLNSLSIQQAEALILHELNHIKQHDYLLNWLLVITENLFFFNPFVLIAARKIRMEREKNCDLQVLYFKYPEIIYAEALLKTAQFQQQQLSLQLAAVHHKKELLHRIRFFSKEENLAHSNSRPFYAVALLGIALLINIFVVSNLLWKQQKLISTGTSTLLLPTSDIQFENREAKSIVTKPIETALSFQPAEQKIVSAITAASPAESLANNDQAAPVSAEEAFVVTEQPVTYSIPVASQEVINDGKEILITEESTEGKIVTIALKALFVNGEWIMQPLWMTTELRATADSSHPLKKDSIIRIIPTVQ